MSDKRDALHSQSRTDTELLLWAVATASGSRRAERWVHVMRIFDVGPTAARRLCERAGVDPDVVVVDGGWPERLPLEGA